MLQQNIIKLCILKNYRVNKNNNKKKLIALVFVFFPEEQEGDSLVLTFTIRVEAFSSLRLKTSSFFFFFSPRFVAVSRLNLQMALVYT